MNTGLECHVYFIEHRSCTLVRSIGSILAWVLCNSSQYVLTGHTFYELAQKFLVISSSFLYTLKLHQLNILILRCRYTPKLFKKAAQWSSQSKARNPCLLAWDLKHSPLQIPNLLRLIIPLFSIHPFLLAGVHSQCSRWELLYQSAHIILSL
jgi:hypothetical protein